jgi:DNA polymerase-3 subunit gamma/tau
MSDNYIVSARKYRPQTFDTVVGQSHITTTLKNAIKNQHLAHAYLFCGPRGVGKTTCARILAKTINCEAPTEDMEACGQCNTCKSFGNNTSFNVFELDAASNNSVDDIRELTNQVRFAPQQGRYKVYIIDEVHMLSAAAFNAFLKTLEEPPPYAIFILATTEKHKILPTILSRCQIFDFKRITTNDIVTHLASIASKEGMVAQEAALHIIAQKSEGAMRDALSMLDRIASFTNGMLTYSNTMEHLNLLDAEYYFKLTDCMLCQDVASTLLLLDQALEKGFEGDIIITGLAEHFRNLLLCKDARMAKMLDVPNDFRQIYYEKANQTPPSFILSSLNVINDSELTYKNATNKRLHVEMCLIRLCFVLVAVSGNMVAQNNTDAGSGDVKKNSDSVGYVQNTRPEPTPSYQHPVPLAQVSEPAPVAPKPMQQVTPAQQQPATQPVPPVATSTSQPTLPTGLPPTNSTGGGRRLSMNMLNNLDEKIKLASENQDNANKSLSVARGLALFEEYKTMIQESGKSVIYSQLCMVRVEVNPPDEVKMISPSELTDMYAVNQKSSLIDFYRERTNMNIRIKTDKQIDENDVASQIPKVLSKSEMYEAMAIKNPNLAYLKEGLGMQIEY